MMYILQHSYKKEYNNFHSEILGRIEYLYNIFNLYFVVKKIVHLQKNLTLPNYYILESFPFSTMPDYLIIVGDTNFVIGYISSHRNEFANKILIIITCKKNYNNIIDTLISSINCKSLYWARLNNGEADYYDGTKWGFNFKITLSELDFYNNTKSNIIERLDESFERIR